MSEGDVESDEQTHMPPVIQQLPPLKNPRRDGTISIAWQVEHLAQMPDTYCTNLVSNLNVNFAATGHE